MTTVLIAVFSVLTLVHLAYYPLAVCFERRQRKAPAGPEIQPAGPEIQGAGPEIQGAQPLVSVVVPAYNEELVLAACLDSILADRYPHKEVIAVDDGSSDGTLDVLNGYRTRIKVLTQPNAGKAAALNAGIAVASGEIMVFADADGIFTPTTITRLLEGFTSPTVGAVCGNDMPSNVNKQLPRLLALLTHVTSLVRRALSAVNCLAIVSGNIGAFRSHVVREIGGFTHGLIGEDLEITWRVHRAGYRVTFQPRSVVRAEVPDSFVPLWKQRVRWTRGLIQTALIHKDMLCRKRYGPVSYYITFTLITGLVLPPLQLVFVAAFIATSQLTWFGLVFSLAILDFAVAIALDKSWKDFKYLYLVPAMALYSPFLSLVVVYALWLEWRGKPAHWNKLARTGFAVKAAAAAREGLAVNRLNQAMKVTLRLEGSLVVSVPTTAGTSARRTSQRAVPGFVQVLSDRSIAWPCQGLDDTLVRSLAVGRTDSAGVLYRVNRGENQVCLFLTGPVRLLDDATLRRLHPRVGPRHRRTERPQMWVWVGVRQAWLQRPPRRR
jgi:biofilm PGA synthesis N-glycosyltransferase PgaC